MKPDLRAAAETYASRGITTIPLGLDEDDLPKRPLNEAYAHLRPVDNLTHEWAAAEGLGVVLGAPSGGLAVIDVDDIGLSEYLQRYLVQTPSPPLMVQTARGKLHIYVQEPPPFTPRGEDMTVTHQGRRCLVQLLAGSYCQAAAPPTPGYKSLQPSAMPSFGRIGEVWRRLSLASGRYYRPSHRYDFQPHERSNSFTTRQLRDVAP